MQSLALRGHLGLDHIAVNKWIKKTSETVKAGDHCDLRISRQMLPFTVNIWIINSCCKYNLRWFEGVVCRQMNCQNEYTVLIWAVMRSHNCDLPVKHIIPQLDLQNIVLEGHRPNH